MKNLRFVISILVMIAGLNNLLTAQPQYYNFNGSGNGSNSFPLNVAGGKDVQILYRAGEINQPSPAPAGLITSVGFRLNSALGPATYTSMTIRLAQSTITDLTPGAFYSGPMTTVYTRASVVLSAPSGSWLNFILDTPFPYDPTQSLIVDFGQCGGTGTLGGTIAYTNMTGVRRVWSVGGCPFVCYASSSIYVYNFGFDLQTSGPPIVTTTPASAVAATTATLNGTVNANGAITTVSFEYGLTTAYGTTVPGVPATVSGSSGTPVSAGISGLVPGTLYHYRVKGTNSNGSVNGNDMTFTTLAMVPTAVTNAATLVTLSSAQLNGTVTANGANTSVSFDWGLTAAYGNNIAAIPGTVSGNTPTDVMASLGGLTFATVYHYRVVATNLMGTTYGSDQTFYTCVVPDTGPITGPENVCLLGSYAYTIEDVPNATGYVWNVPPGAVITGGAGTTIISVTFPAGSQSGLVSVYATNVCGNGTPTTLTVYVNPLPVPTISGPGTSCVGYTNVTYTTQAGNSNYIWGISPGGTITGGAGTNSITVSWTGAGAQNVTVNYTTPAGCDATTPTSYPVTVNASPAPTITGDAEMCVNSGYYSYTTEPGFSNYQWTISPGGTISSGQGTNQVQVTWNASGSQWIAINYSNQSGCYAPEPVSFPVTVDGYPAAAGAITGTSTLCSPASGVTYSVAPISGAATYVWNLPAGAEIATGEGTNTITVDFGSNAESGDITVYGNSICGNGAPSPPFGVTVNPTPPAPTIVQVDNMLSSDAPLGNQWYKDGAMITGATNQTHDAALTGNGEYMDIVTLSGCASGESNHLQVVLIGINDQQKGGMVSLYPNPTDGMFTVSITSLSQETFSIRVFNNLGVLITELNGIDVKGTVEKVIDLRAASDGSYTVLIQGNKSIITKKVLLNK